MKKFMFMIIFKIFFENWKLFLPVILKFKNSYFQGTILFSWIKIWRFLKQKIERFGPNKTTFFFLIQKKFRMIASNKHLDLSKIVNFIRSKGKTANFWKPCKSFKIIDEILTCKGKRWVIFDNDRKILNHSILALIQHSFTTFELQGK